MTLSGPSAAARLNINCETFFLNLILWSLYFRSFYFQEFVFPEFVMAPDGYMLGIQKFFEIGFRGFSDTSVHTYKY